MAHKRSTVPFIASLTHPLSTTNFVLVLIAALLLGPGIPLALLYAAKWRVSRIPPTPLLAERIPVEVNGDTVLRDGEPFAMADSDLVHPVPGLARATRKLTVLGATLTATTGRSPFGSGHVLVDADGCISTGSALPGTDRSGLRAVLPLAVHNTWVVLHDPDGPAGAAEVLLLVGGRTDNAARQRIYDDVARRLPESAVCPAAARCRSRCGQCARCHGTVRRRSAKQCWPQHNPTLSIRLVEEPDATFPDSRLRRFRRRDAVLHDGPAALRTAQRRSGQADRRLAIRAHRRAQRGRTRPGRAGERARAGRHLHRLRSAGQQLCHPRRLAFAATGRRWRAGHDRDMGTAATGSGDESDLVRCRTVSGDRPDDHAEQGR